MRTAMTGLATWIDELRYRVSRGHLATLDPIDLGDGTGVLSGERTIRIMLADLDDVERQRRVEPVNTQASIRRQRLLNDFRQLRELIG
jgi:hypothetical protein